MESELYKRFKSITGCGISLHDREYYRCFTEQTSMYLHPSWFPKSITCGGDEYGDAGIRVCVRCVQKAGIIW